MPLLSPPRPSVRRALARAASALALLALTAGAAHAQRTVTLAVDDDEISENGGVAEITATISETSTQDITVRLDFARDAALASTDIDFSETLPDIIIPAGDLSASATATAVDDGTNEGDESFSFTIGEAVFDDGDTDPDNDPVAATPAAPSSVTITINDDDDPVAISLAANPTTIADEDGGTSTITVTLDDETNADVTVTLATDGDGDGSSLSPTSVTIPRGETEGTATLTASDDADTADETVTVSVDNVAGGNVTGAASASVVVTITDDDDGATSPTNPTVTLSVDGAGQTQIAEAGGVATVTATLTQATNEDVVVQLTPEAGFTNEAGDLTFDPSSITITVPEGETEGTLTVTANPDADTDDETVTLAVTDVSGGGATESTTPQSVTITVVDDDATGADPEVTLAVADENVEEGRSTTITASLTGGALANGDVTVNLGYSGGAGQFTAPAALVIPDGQNSGSVTFVANDDDDDEDNEVVTVSITTVSGNATESGNQTATITIVDNDGGFVGDQVTASFGQTAVTVDESAGSVAIPVRLSATLSSPVDLTVTLATGDSADVAGFTSRTVTVPAGSDSAAVVVTLTDDAVAEEDETFTFQLSSSDARVEVEDGTVTVTVTDGDAPAEDGVTITEYDSVVRDGDARFVELRTDGAASFGDLSLVYLAADSTVVEVDDLEGRATDADGFVVISGDGAEEGARRAGLVPDSFVGVAVVRGDAPAVGTPFDFDGDNVVDVLFVDEAAVAQSRGLDPEDGSIQRQAGGQPAFATPATPGGANAVGIPVSNEPGGPLAEAVGTVFPNPSAGRAALELTVATAQQVRVSVFDALGRRVAVAYDGEARPGTALRVPLGGAALAPGVYVVRVDGETFVESRRLTVAR